MNAGRKYAYTKAKCLKLNLEIPYAEMLEEAKSLRDKFIPYDQGTMYLHQGWYALPIHGLGDDKTLSYPAYGYNNPIDAANHMGWTTFAEQCPITINWLKTKFPSRRFGRVRFMLLESGGYISPHVDSEHQIAEAVNIALSNPKDCVWHWGDGTDLNFNPGEAYVMNISYEHSINNNSNQDRYHMIVHHYEPTDEWEQLLIQSAEEAGEEIHFHHSTELY
jgi:hypothetical protein